MKVVLIDDSDQIARLLQMVLQKEPGIEVETLCKDFQDYQNKIEWDTVKVAVVDQFLGKSDGREILQWLREQHPDIRRIMLTADAYVDKEKTSAQEVLIKPVAFQDLVEAVKRGSE